MQFYDETNCSFAMEADAEAPMLELTHNHNWRDPYEPGDGYSHVAFAVDDVEGTVAKLRDKGVEVALEPKTKTIEGHDYRISFVVDPDGYRVEFVERGTMKVGGIVQ